jgi:glucose-1-phosphate adenylyltransferase
VTGNHDDPHQVLAIVLAGGQGQRLRPLTERRAKPAVPFGATYRIIDFALSNCVNSDFRRIIVLTQYESLTLQRHIRQTWSILSPEIGEFVDILPPQQRLPNRWYLGTADAIFQNLYLLQQERPRWVLILGGDHVYKMNYARLLDAHRRHEADATIACIDVPRSEAKDFGVVQVDSARRIIAFREKPSDPAPMPDTPDHSLISMGIYLFTTEVLVRALVQDAKSPGSTHDFGRDVIPQLIGDHQVIAYNFHSRSQPGQPYWRDVGTVESYWQANMDLLARHPEFDLFEDSWPIRCGLGNRPPAKICVSTEGLMGVAEQSLLAPGSIVSGGHVRRSVIGPRVEIHNGSLVEECVIMGGVSVGKHVQLRRVIVEESTAIPDGTVLGYDLEADRRRFKVTESGIVVVPTRSPF